MRSEALNLCGRVGIILKKLESGKPSFFQLSIFFSMGLEFSWQELLGIIKEDKNNDNFFELWIYLWNSGLEPLPHDVSK